MDGQGAQTAVEGFMRGWKFGSDILREREDKADRQSDRQQKKIEQGRATERFGREQKQWADQDVDRADELAKRETPEEVIAGRKRKVQADELSLGEAERKARQAPSDEEAAEERRLGLEQKRANVDYTRSSASRARAAAKQDKAADDSNKILAALDYLEQNEQTFSPENMKRIDRVYTAFATESFDKLERGDVDEAAKVMVPLLDKRADFNGMPIVERIPKVLTRDGKIVFEMKYKVQNPDGSIVDAEAGPLRKATEDGTDAIYEMEEDEAMRLLAGHELIGRDIMKLAEMGGSYKEAVQQLRQQYIEQAGPRGVPALKSVGGTAGGDRLATQRVQLADGVDVGVQAPYGAPIDDSALVAGGVVVNPDTGEAMPARTLGDAKRALGIAGAGPAAPAAPAADGPVTVSSQQEVAALPKGTKFVFNGKEYIKK